MKKGKKINITNVILVLILLVGLSLLLYPTISDYWNSFHSSQVITNYSESVAEMKEDDYEAILKSAREYNEELIKKGGQYILTNSEMERYNSLLNVGGSGVMGYIDIPSINCKLPIYHGTDEAVLQVAAGHLEWSSLPVGGASTHCVISGHRGLTSAKLFTNLDKLSEGDIFTLTVLNEVFTYEVDQILIVEPDDVEALQIVEGQDYCTLVTCTPYGINTHRLLVRGHRIANIEDTTANVFADAVTIEPLIVAAVLEIPMLLVLIIVLIVRDRRKKKSKE